MQNGGCRCGKIRFLVEGEPLGGVACHCRDCQYMVGGSANVTRVAVQVSLSIPTLL